MKRCWLHIGMHKTGSTAIQRKLGGVGRSDGWRYITLEKNRRHLNAAMFAMFASQPKEYHEFRSSDATPEDIARKGRLLREKLELVIRESTEETLILSAESLDQMDREGVERLAEFLRPLFDDIRVIGYVRPPAGLLSSRFQENVKHGKKRFDFSRFTADYRFRFEKYDEAFGPGRVTLVKFDPKSFTNHCVLADFSERVGITLPVGTSARNVNKGLCGQACGILFAYNKFGAGFGRGRHALRENRLLVRALSAMKGDKFRLNPALVAAVNDKSSDDIRWMESRLGTSLDEPPPKGGGIEVEDDLLHIKAAALRDFAGIFERVAKVTVPLPPDSATGVIPPEQAAAYVQSCRELAGARVSKKDKPSKGRGRGVLRSLVRRLRGAFGGTRSK